MGADKPNGVANYNRRPPQRPFWQRIKYAFYNPEEGTVLGRTPHRWGVIGLIYLVMYICIIIFFSLCMCGLLAFMDEKIPYFTLGDSIIGDNPGMGHRPLVFEEGALIWFNAKNCTQTKKYVDNIDKFLAPYQNKSLLSNGGENQLDCGATKPNHSQVCAFNISLLGPCSKENDYGYNSKQPCIIIKLNKIFSFKPAFYDDPATLPKDMPKDVANFINSTTSAQQRRKVWVSCAGERPADIDALGPLAYYPHPGLDEIYFPYNNTPGYLSPVVAVQLLNPAKMVIINIRCRAWARNIKYTDSLKERLGSTHLEIMIDDDELNTTIANNCTANATEPNGATNPNGAKVKKTRIDIINVDRAKNEAYNTEQDTAIEVMGIEISTTNESTKTIDGVVLPLQTS